MTDLHQQNIQNRVEMPRTAARVRDSLIGLFRDAMKAGHDRPFFPIQAAGALLLAFPGDIPGAIDFLKEADPRPKLIEDQIGFTATAILVVSLRNGKVREGTYKHLKNLQGLIDGSRREVCR